MPLAGFICEITHDPVTFDECLECAHIDHPCSFTYEILQAMTRNPEERANAGVSVTTVVSCVRKGYYGVTQLFYQYPHLLWPAQRGTLFHTLVENNKEPGAIYEHRFGREVSGIMLTGQIDKLVPQERLIVDYKTKQYLPKTVPDDYVWQANAYGYLVQNGVVISTNESSDLKPGDLVNYEIDRFGIVFMTMLEVRKYEVAKVEVAKFLEYRVAQVAEAMSGGPLPERGYRDYRTNKICTEWCPHYSQCVGEE